MRLPRALALVVLAALVGLVAPGVVNAGAADRGANGVNASADIAAQKKKPVRCKAGQIKAKVGKQRKCRPFKAVFPRPRAADPRVAFLTTALALAPRTATKNNKTSKRRRTRSLKSGFGRPGKKAYRKILKALPKALAEADRLAPQRAPIGAPATAAISRARDAVARAAQERCSGDGPELGTSSIRDGGVEMTTSFAGGGMGMSISVSTGGLTVKIQYFTTVGCDDFDPPACPTSAGAADAEGSKLDRARIEVRRNGEVISSQSTTVRRRTTTHGQVAADALLDHVDVDDAVSISSGVNGVNISGSITRHTRINMRTEQYDPSQSRVSFAGAQQLTRSDSGSFASLARGVIGVYRSAESSPGRLGTGAGWAVFDRPDGNRYCISVKFDPDIGTRKLKKNTSGTFTGKAIAASDGQVAADGRWEQTRQQFGTFSPAEPRGGSPTISYRVTDGGPGKLLLVTYKVRSTAGVAEYTWSQDTEAETINHISGPFSGTQTLATILGPSLIRFSGTLAYNRFGPAVFSGASGHYRLVAGDFTAVASGIEGSGITGCRQSGTKRFTIPLGQGTFDVQGTPPDQLAPYHYSFDAHPNAETMTITRHSCPPGASEWEGTKFQSGVFAPFTASGAHVSGDGVAYNGSQDQRFGGSGIEFSWAFRGTP